MFKPEFSHFLFNPYMKGFWSLKYSPLPPGSEELTKILTTFHEQDFTCKVYLALDRSTSCSGIDLHLQLFSHNTDSIMPGVWQSSQQVCAFLEVHWCEWAGILTLGFLYCRCMPWPQSHGTFAALDSGCSDSHNVESIKMSVLSSCHVSLCEIWHTWCNKQNWA